MLHKCLFAALVLLLPSSLIAQEEESISFFRKESRNERFEAGAPVMVGVVSPAFLPDMGFSISGRALLEFKTKRNNPYLSHSELPLALDVNFRGDLRSLVSLRSYWYDDLLEASLDIFFENLESHYWGIGYLNNTTIEQGNTTTAHHRLSKEFSPGLAFRLPLHFYAGIGYQYRSTRVTELSDLMKEDLDILRDGTEVKTSGLGFSLLYDTRSENSAKTQGLAVKLKVTFYDSLFSSDNNFSRIQLEYRHFMPVIRQGSLLGWHLEHQTVLGNVPWTELPSLGTGISPLRGIYPGRYRDHNATSLTLEYRHGFLKSGTEELSRHAVVFWIGGGTIYSSLAEIEGGIAFSGIGYRYAIAPDKNLRIDLGFGTENAGLYVEINEAF